MAKIPLTPPPAPTFYFIGVTTRHSSSRRLFPLWMAALGRPEVQWHGIDLPLHASPDSYRQVVNHIKQEKLALGALVTSHKLDLLAATHDLFDELGPFAALTQEVSSIAKDAGKLVGRATDSVAGGQSLTAVIGPNYFTHTNGHVLILGAGGAGVALCLHLWQQPQPGNRPQQIIVVDRENGRLTHLQQLLHQHPSPSHCRTLLHHTPAQNDALLASLPAGSIIINATGMGKDTPGSPLTHRAQFPPHSIVWELNYRGQLDFWRQAQAQQAARSLTVVDGWDYFVRGWAQVIAHVLHLTIETDMLAQLSQLAATIR